MKIQFIVYSLLVLSTWNAYAGPASSTCEGEKNLNGTVLTAYKEFKDRVARQPFAQFPLKRGSSLKRCTAEVIPAKSVLTYIFRDGSKVQITRTHGEIPSESTKLITATAMTEKNAIDLAKAQMAFLFKDSCKIDWSKPISGKTNLKNQEKAFECADSGLNGSIRLQLNKTGKATELTSSFIL